MLGVAVVGAIVGEAVGVDVVGVSVGDAVGEAVGAAVVGDGVVLQAHPGGCEHVNDNEMQLLPQD